MKKNLRIKLLMLIPFFLVVFTFGMKPLVDVSSAEPTVLSVSHLPTIVSYQTNVTVTAEFEDDTNITGIKIQICSFVPEYLCYSEKPNMTSEVANTWIGSFIVNEESGVIGYRLFIYHTDGVMYTPNTSDYLGYPNITESYGFYYFTINITMPTNTAPLNPGVPIALLAIGTIMVLRGDRRKKKIEE